MTYLTICAVAFLASGLTFFSGFGLGTLLLPAFSIFFPVPIAITLTAVVHFLNNLFKLILMGRFANVRILLKFGIPSVIAAFLGAILLTTLSGMDAWLSYSLAGKIFYLTPMKTVVATLMFIFAMWELVPALAKIEMPGRYLLPGGFLSGFFGGLSGHQGALRSAFLSKSGLSKEALIGTSVVIGSCVDLTRISIYLSHLKEFPRHENILLLLLAAISAFLGTLIGKVLLVKITMKNIQTVIGIGLILFSLLLATGII